MKSYIKLVVAVLLIFAAMFAVTNIIWKITDITEAGRPYLVEAERLARKIGKGVEYDLADYKYITAVTDITGGFESGGSDYVVKKVGNRLYRFDYSYSPDVSNVMVMFNVCLSVVCVLVLALLAFLYFRLIRPFEKIRDYPKELAKGNLTAPMKAGRYGFYGGFLWGMDILREKLESQKSAELALQKQNKTMVLSLSHDIKTPLGIIELYAKALEKGLYKDEAKKLETARNINAKCEEIRGYVDGIVKTSSEDFLNFEVENGDFYLSELIGSIRTFYTDRLGLLKIGFTIESFGNIILSGDKERSIEVLQNIIENAVKYGDGKEIAIGFSREEDCQLIHIRNTGCELSDSELPHIFDSFWRGSNVGGNGGSGLGLYICRSLMHRMDGDIYASVSAGCMTVTTVFRIA